MFLVAETSAGEGTARQHRRMPRETLRQQRGPCAYREQRRAAGKQGRTLSQRGLLQVINRSQVNSESQGTHVTTKGKEAVC